MLHILKYSALFLWVSLYSYSYAQENNLTFSADSVTVKGDDLLYAEGNVIVKYDQIFVKASSLSYDKKSNKLSLDKILEFTDDSGTKLSAENGQIDANFEKGIIEAVRLVLHEQIKIYAKSLTIENGSIDTVEEIWRVTSCEECETKQPRWHFQAASAKRDLENKNIVYRNVSFRVKGIPLLYFPYLRLPDPTVTRARGFLVPEAVLTSNLASGIKVPYFIPMGISSDILITPYFSPKTRTLEYRYRKKFQNGGITLKGAFSDDDLADEHLRYFSKIDGNFLLGYGLNLNFNAGKVGDRFYLGDYVFSDGDDFNSKISLGKTSVGKNQFFEGNLNYQREKQQNSTLNEYYSFSGSYVKNISPSILSGGLKFLANLNSSINVNDDNSITRPPSSAQIGLLYKQKNFVGPIKFSSEFFSNVNSFVNSADVITTKQEFSFQYGILTSISVPQINKGVDLTNFLSPKISLSLNGQENNILGDYFIGADELSWGNIHAGKKITSLSENELDLSVSVGIENRVFWKNGQQIETAIALSKINALSYAPAANLGLTSGKINYLGRFSYKTRNHNILAANAIFSSDSVLLKDDIRGKYTNNNVSLKGQYEFINRDVNSLMSKEATAVNFLLGYTFDGLFQASYGGRFDLYEDKMAETSFQFGLASSHWNYNYNQKYSKEDLEKYSLSAIYDDRCTRLIFSFENRYSQLGPSEPIRILGFRVQLKPFTNLAITQRLGDLQTSSSVF